MRHSDSLAKIGAALVAFQKGIENPLNSKVNPHFKSKYAPLPDVLDHVRPALAKNGLAVVQGVQSDEQGRAGVSTMIVHESGEFIVTEPVLLKDRNDNAQGAGSAVTYARRYSICAALGIASDDDDDANGASHGKPPAKPQDDAAVLGEALDKHAEAAKGDPKPEPKPLPGTPEEQAAFQWLCDRIQEAKTADELESLQPKAKVIAESLKGRLRIIWNGQKGRIQKGEKR